MASVLAPGAGLFPREPGYIAPTPGANASLGGAFKAHMESRGLGLSWYRDGAPRDRAGELAAHYPYGVVQTGIGFAPELHGDTAADDAHEGTTELVQIDLYELARSAPNAAGRTAVTEAYMLPSRIERELRRCARDIDQRAPWHVYGVRVQTGQRWPIADNVLRHTWTVAVRRDTDPKGLTA